MNAAEPAGALQDGLPASAEGVLELEALTASERRVLALALAGHSLAEIAQRLRLAEASAREQLGRAYGKLGLSGRVDLATRVATAAAADDPPPLRTDDDPDPRPVSQLPLVIGLVIGLAIVVLISILLPIAMVVTGPGLLYLGWRLRQSHRSSALGFAALWILLVGVVLSVFVLGFLLLILLDVALAGPPPG